VPAVTVLSLPAAAVAAPPEGWDEAAAVSPLQFLLVLVLIPAGLFLVIALLAALPSMMRGSSSYQPGLAWRNEPEWFGGPRDGLDKVDRGDQQSLESTSPERGGASGSW
jgi:hypothetical protein